VLYAVIFRNRREELVIRAIDAHSEKEAIDKIIPAWQEEYGEDDDEGIYPLFEPRAERIESGMGIYHEDRS